MGNLINTKTKMAANIKPILEFILQFQKNKPKTFNLIFAILLILPILLFTLPIIVSGNKIRPGDGDYYIQLYEALRISIFKYDQFPWWNPWISGGIPLFANPQFGLISIQTPLVLLFGSAFGYKIALIIYMIIGFFGFKTLFNKVFNADMLRSILLAYIWTFGSFVVYRLGGHYTFLMAGLMPWAIYLYYFRHLNYNWLKLSALLSLLVWTAIHYVTILIVLLVIVLSILSILKRIIHKNTLELKREIILLLKVFLLTLIICLPRLYYVAEYTYDYPRIEKNSIDPFIGTNNGLYALFGIDQYNAVPRVNSPWGWMEMSTSISTIMILVLAYIIFVYFSLKKDNRKRFTTIMPFVGYLILITMLFSLGLGDFGITSPYHWIRQIPVFSSMRVSPRWLAWTSLLILCLVAAVRLNKKDRNVINILLIFAVIQLYISGIMVIGNGYIVTNIKDKQTRSIIEQRKFWHNNRVGNRFHDENFTEATINNIGQVYAGDSIIDTRGPVPTSQCPIDDGCPFISTNAEIAYWSPNKIIVKRLAPGPITLQINPGSRWRINGQYIFKDLKVVEPVKHFMITDPAENIVLEYVPKFSPQWLKNQLVVRLKN